MPRELIYPTTADVLSIHEDIVKENSQTHPGVRSAAVIESAIKYISVGYFDQRPDTVHAKAAHLMRLLVAEHPFVDGNKRTALNTVTVFYDLNEFEFEYEDESIRAILKEFASDAGAADMSEVITYFRDHARPAEE